MRRIFSQVSYDLKQQQAFVKSLLQEVDQISLELYEYVYVSESFVILSYFGFKTYRPVSSAPNLVSYLGLSKDPSDSEYSLRQRAGLCYVVHAISLILKKAKTSSELGLDSPQSHPTYANVIPLLSKISIPLIQ